MRSTIIAALLGVSLLPAAGFAQTGPQTAAVESTTTAALATAPAGGITRDQFIQRAKDRAAQRAAERFDQMDTDHNGVLERAEMRTWRDQHARRAAPAQTPSATQ